mgnify:CR=1 FL=1
MDTQNENREMLSPYVSVDCVLLGINDDKLTVLLAERKSEEGELIGYKLPGSLIYENEDLDDAAYRILNDSTGLKRVQLKQFRCLLLPRPYLEPVGRDVAGGDFQGERSDG